jgi:alpha-2-macroglobulin
VRQKNTCRYWRELFRRIICAASLVILVFQQTVTPSAAGGEIESPVPGNAPARDGAPAIAQALPPPPLPESAGEELELPAPGLPPPPDSGSLANSRPGIQGWVSLKLSPESSFRQAAASPDGAKAPETKALDATAVKEILARLKALKIAPRTEFVVRPPSAPPPRPEKRIEETFPPQVTAPPRPVLRAASALKITRKMPEGEIGTDTRQLAVTFSQPMIALSAVGQDTAKQNVVRLVPCPKGNWRWVDTRTLLFEPAGKRFPFATQYRATVAAGAASATGGKLAQSLSWSFRTPPPAVQFVYPSEKTRTLTPNILIGFDQDVDCKAALAKISVALAGNKRSGKNKVLLPYRQLSPAELSADRTLRATLAALSKDRRIGIKCLKELPRQSTIEVAVAKGLTAREGPLASASAQSFQFHTYGPLRLRRLPKEWKPNPSDDLLVLFTNNLNVKSFRSSMVSVNPPIPGASIKASEDKIRISGKKTAGTKYAITIAASLSDEFGQPLGKTCSQTCLVTRFKPGIYAGEERYITLAPRSPKRFSVFSINYSSLKVEAYKVAPPDLDQFFDSDFYRGRFVGSNFFRGRKASWTATLPVKPEPDQVVETPVELEPFLKGKKFGDVVLHIVPQPQAKRARDDDSDETQELAVWIKCSNIRIETTADRCQLKVYATALDTGLPLAGAQIKLGPASAITDASGSACLSLPQESQKYLIARLQDDVCYVKSPGEYGFWRSAAPLTAYRWYGFCDRGVYRPGERVYVKGCVRGLAAGPAADVEKCREGAEILLSAMAPDGRELSHSAIKLDAFGAFSHSFDLPKEASTGRAEISASFESGLQREVYPVASFLVEEFRRPEFEVTVADSEGNLPHFAGSLLRMDLSAKQYTGSPLADVDVNWEVKVSPAGFSPAGWSDFCFGPWRGYWWEESTSFEPVKQSLDEKTDAAGRSRLLIDVGKIDPPQSVALSLQGTVRDINRQTVSVSTDALVHAASRFVGLKTSSFFYRAGEPLAVSAIVTDINGRAEKSKIKFRVYRREWNEKDKKYLERDGVEREEQSQEEPILVRFDTKNSGSYGVKAFVTDEQGRTGVSETVVAVCPAEEGASAQTERPAGLVLMADKEEYSDGEIAEIAIRSPFPQAQATATLARDGFLSVETIEIKDGTAFLKIPVKDAYVPALHLNVQVVEKCKPAAEKWAAHESADLRLSIPPRKRALKLSLVPEKSEIEPGGSTTVSVSVADAGGKAVAGSQVSLAVVDESVLALTNYKLGDPLEAIYVDRGSGLSRRDSAEDDRAYDLAKARKEAQGSLTEAACQGIDLSDGSGGYNSMPVPSLPPPPLPSAARAKECEAPPPPPPPEKNSAQAQIGVRRDFNPLALFQVSALTGNDGKVTVPVKVPDNLTRYRIMAVALAGERQFGCGESNLTARLPLMLRPSPPRFLNFGDQCRLTFTVQNQTATAQVVSVAVRGSTPELVNGQGQQLTLAAGQRAELGFATRADAAGEAVFQAAATAGSYSDAAEFSLPVYTPATTESFATYGSIAGDQVLVQPVKPPADAFVQFGGMEVSTSSTALQELTDAVVYLKQYNFECSEQLASRIIVLAGLKNVASAFQLPHLNPADMQVAVSRDIRLLAERQNEDGSFGLWKKGDHAWPFVGIYAAHALKIAAKRGFAVSPQLLALSGNYLKNIKSKIPADYDAATKISLEAFALYVRAESGDRDLTAARKLLQATKGEELSPETLGWLLGVLAADTHSAQRAKILQWLHNRVSETASTAEFKWPASDWSYLTFYSDLRGNAVLLDSLIAAAPDDELVPKLVKGLLKARRHGYWGNTQENAFCCTALDRYFSTYEKEKPEFIARLWLGDAFLGEEKFAGRSMDTHVLNLPMSYLSEKKNGETEPLLLSKQGPGRLYYRLALKYAPRDLRLQPLERGFAVRRTYEGAENPGDVKRDAEGAWHVKAGSLVRVRLSVSTPACRYHVALVDPLPAGFEPLNPELAGTKTVADPGQPGANAGDDESDASSPVFCWWRNRFWCEHENLRDNRAEAFTSQMWEGDYKYSYLARATTPGRFVAPPAKAEEMYEPETFGRAASEIVIVE